MLFDPKWEVKADPFSLESLIGWLEKQPQNRQYCFSKWNDCLLAQWAKSMDPQAFTIGPEDISSPEMPTGFHYSINGAVADLNRFQPIAVGRNYSNNGQTFSAALSRARQALAAS